MRRPVREPDFPSDDGVIIEGVGEAGTKGEVNIRKALMRLGGFFMSR
jgi:hypothetical protein